MEVIEIMAQSEKSWEDAAQLAVDAAHKSVRGIKSVYVQDLMAHVKDGKITVFRINAKVTFEVEV
jgi:flavin-binding protein dodecin